MSDLIFTSKLSWVCPVCGIRIRITYTDNLEFNIENVLDFVDFHLLVQSEDCNTNEPLKIRLEETATIIV